jgi:hypothetical protein
MKKLIPLFIAILILGCKNDGVSKADVHFLNGYWEITEVEFPDGSVKTYGLNQNIDFIHLENGEGYRKKLQPKFDGSFDTSNDMEYFTLATTENEVALHYKSDFSEWEEQLVHIDSLIFSVTNPEGVRYTYKRFEPIKIPQ